MNEIRIYFECLEQAYNYIFPLIKEGVRKSERPNTVIKLIRKPRILKGASGVINAIYTLTTPDFLITLCKNEKEIPIIIGEISEAVKTEDHELQRAIGAIAAALVDCIFLKISGEKLSPRDHGGKKEFDPLTIGKILSQTFNYSGFLLGNWPTLENNPFVLKRDKHFLSCPPSIPLLKQTLPAIIKEVINKSDEIVKDGKTICNVIVPKLSVVKEFSEYQKHMNTVKGSDEFIKDWESRKDISTRPRVYLDKDILKIKINRFSHAADPDRGMLIFSSTVINPRTVLARYIVKKEGSNLLEDFIGQSIDEGLPSSFLLDLKKFLKNKLKCKEIVISKFLKDKKEEWKNNKVLFSLFLFSDGIVVQRKNKEINLKWDREGIFKIKKSDLKESLIKLLSSRKYVKPLRVEKAEKLNEDEVTYIVVHQILKPNNFDIIFVSYPGAQGGFPILPIEEMGRRRRRKYIDVIAWLPPRNKVKSNDIALEESKELFNKKMLEDVIERLDLFRKQKGLFNALKSALRMIDPNRKLKRIFIGVAFGVKEVMRTMWSPTKVDFIVRIVDKKKWQLAYFGNELKYAFHNMEGKIKLPDVYKVMKDQKQQTLAFR